MKKILLLIVLLSSQLSAQTMKGSILVGGNLTADRSKTEYQDFTLKNVSINASPKAAIFVIDNLCYGASIPFSFTKSKGTGDYDLESFSLGLGPFIRYYFPLEKLHVITELGYTWNKLNSITGNSDPMTGVPSSDEVKTNTQTFQAASGVGLPISKSATIEFLLNYQNTDVKTDNSNNVGEFKRNRFFLSIGFQFYIPKKTTE